eukprot:1422533-Rhodomonas_salina.1
MVCSSKGWSRSARIEVRGRGELTGRRMVCLSAARASSFSSLPPPPPQRSLHPPKSNTRNHLPGTNSTETAVSCTVSAQDVKLGVDMRSVPRLARQCEILQHDDDHTDASAVCT